MTKPVVHLVIHQLVTLFKLSHKQDVVMHSTYSYLPFCSYHRNVYRWQIIICPRIFLGNHILHRIWSHNNRTMDPLFLHPDDRLFSSVGRWWTLWNAPVIGLENLKPSWITGESHVWSRRWFITKQAYVFPISILHYGPVHKWNQTFHLLFVC